MPWTAWPSLDGCLQLKRAFFPVVSFRRSSFKSECMPPTKYEMTFFLDLQCWRTIFAMYLGPGCCLQAVRNDCWLICNECEPGGLLVRNDRGPTSATVCKPASHRLQAATHTLPRSLTIFLTAPLSHAAVAIHLGPCEKLRRYRKLATSSYLHLL
jgi:hypothetical protein